MNLSVHARQTNLKFFFGAVGASIVMLAASGFFLKSVLSGDSGGLDASTKACLATMRTNGFNPDTKKEDVIQVAMAMADDIERFVYKSGYVIASCPAYTLTDYCAGAGCPKPGVSFTLKKKEL